MRRRPTSLDEPRAAQLIEHRRQLRLRVSRDRPDHLLVELPADAGSDLRHLACWSQAVEARHERLLQRRRNGQRRKWADELEMAIAWRCLPDHRFKDRFRQFLDEQRHALSAGEDGFDDDGRKLPSARRTVDKRSGCWPPEAIEAEECDMREIRPRRRHVRPQCGHEKYRQNPDPVHYPLEKLPRRRIEPMRVLEDQEHRPLA